MESEKKNIPKDWSLEIKLACWKRCVSETAIDQTLDWSTLFIIIINKIKPRFEKQTQILGECCAFVEVKNDWRVCFILQMVTNSSQLWLVKLDHVTLKVKGVPFLVLCSVFGKIKTSKFEWLWSEKDECVQVKLKAI